MAKDQYYGKSSIKKDHSLSSRYSQFMYKKSKGLHNSFLNQSNKRTNFKSENWTPRKLSAMHRIQYDVLKSFQNDQNKHNLDSNRKNDIKNFIRYKLQKSWEF